MSRRLLVGSIIAIGLWTAPASGQVSRGITFGVGPPGGLVPGGGFRQSTPSLSAPVGGVIYRGPAYYGPRAGVGFRGGYRSGLGGFRGYYSVYPYSSYYPYSAYSSYYGGFGGGFISGGYSPVYVVPGPDEYDPSSPAVVVPSFPPEAPFVGLSGEAAATLSLQLPAAATVWLDGKEVAGPPATERTLKSPILRPGQKYTFHIRAKWETNGRTYETTKEVTLGPGARSRLLVVSGTAVADGN